MLHICDSNGSPFTIHSVVLKMAISWATRSKQNLCQVNFGMIFYIILYHAKKTKFNKFFIFKIVRKMLYLRRNYIATEKYSAKKIATRNFTTKKYATKKSILYIFDTTRNNSKFIAIIRYTH